MSPLPSCRPPAGATAAFARFIARAPRAGLGRELGRVTARAFANWLGCALGGHDEPSTAPIHAVARGLAGAPRATVVGRSERFDPVNAALVNGVAANALDYDDMHVPTLIHPTVPVAAAALALAEDVDADGPLFLAALACGIEVECRLGLALFPAHYDAGWHSTATLGTLGAAAAAAVVLRLDESRAACALAIAATQSAGLRAMLPNACKSFNTGRAAAAGTLAALLARAGLASAPAVLEERHGLFHALGAPRDPEALTSGLGERYLVTEVSLKPYPCGVVIHPLIDACLEIARAPGFAHQSVARLDARVHPRALELAGRPDPQDAITGRFSLHHAAAIALTRRAAGLTEFDATDVRDPDCVRLRAAMRIDPDAGLAPDHADVRVTLVDGNVREAHVRHPSGSPQRPLDDAALTSKFVALATRALPEPRARALLAECLALERVASMRAFAAQCRPA